MPDSHVVEREIDLSTEQVPRDDPRSGVMSIDPSGAACFVRTGVPIQNLWDYLAGGDDLDMFLDCFSSVSREHAVRLIELAAEKLLDGLSVR